MLLFLIGSATPFISRGTVYHETVSHYVLFIKGYNGEGEVRWGQLPLL